MTEKDKKQSNEDAFEEAHEFCEACGGVLKAEKVNLEEFEGGKLYLMENVVAYVCQECGEMWVPEPILNEFEDMMKTAKLHHAKQHPGKKRSNLRKAGSRIKRHKK